MTTAEAASAIGHDHPNFIRTQEAWDRVARNDFAMALEAVADDVVVDNGPGAGPWRHVEGKPALLDFLAAFVPLFEGTWRQLGRCIYADDSLSIALVHETGTASSGAKFDNLAVYVSRFDSDGRIGRLWTADMAHEELERFWQRNPPASISA